MMLLSTCGLRYNEGTSLPARRPSAGEMPGRCGCCLAADTHRPLLSRWAEPTDSVALASEAIVVACGSMVVGDDGQGIHEERAEIVDAAAYPEAVSSLAVA